MLAALTAVAVVAAAADAAAAAATTEPLEMEIVERRQEAQRQSC